MIITSSNPNKFDISNHIATITSFMTDYLYSAVNNDAHSQFALVDGFYKYIVAACWRKMYQRVSHWSSIGLLQNLTVIKSAKVVTCFKKFPVDAMENLKIRFEQHSDKKLITQLRNIKNILKDISSKHHWAYQDKVSFDKLILVVESDAASTSLYNEETCGEFHDLLVSVLFAYFKYLHHLDCGIRATPQLSCDSLLEHAAAALSYLRLLYHITGSFSYRLHLHVISSSLSSIAFRSRHNYEQFASAAELGFRDGSGMYTGNSVPSIEEDDEFEPELDVLSSYRAIFSKLVSYIGALQTLTRYCNVLATSGNRTPVKFNASLLSTSYPKAVPFSWSNIENALQKIPLKSHMTVQIVLAMLRNVAETYKSPTSEHRAFALFRKLAVSTTSSNKVINYPTSTYHCEALLLSLICYCDDLKCKVDGPLLELLQVGMQYVSRYRAKILQASRSGTMVVSKLCCPVCWELLRILGSNTSTAMCGRHSTLHFLHLPTWLPDHVVAALLQRFRTFASEELHKMHLKHLATTKSHAHTPSQETKYASSIASDELVEDERMEYFCPNPSASGPADRIRAILKFFF